MASPFRQPLGGFWKGMLAYRWAFVLLECWWGCASKVWQFICLGWLQSPGVWSWSRGTCHRLPQKYISQGWGTCLICIVPRILLLGPPHVQVCFETCRPHIPWHFVRSIVWILSPLVVGMLHLHFLGQMAWPCSKNWLLQWLIPFFPHLKDVFWSGSIRGRHPGSLAPGIRMLYRPTYQCWAEGMSLWGMPYLDQYSLCIFAIFRWSFWPWQHSWAE